MDTNGTGTRSNITVFATSICLVLIFQGIYVTAGTATGPEPLAPQPRAVTGWLFCPNGTMETTVTMPITVTNNNTGASAVTLVNDPGSGLPPGNYQVDSFLVDVGDTIYVNCTHVDKWAKNQSVYSGALPFVLCNISMIQLRAREIVNATNGGTMDSFDGAFSLSVPAGSIVEDTEFYAVDSPSPKYGALDTVDMGPSGLVFSPPATLIWSYSTYQLGAMNEHSLRIFTLDGTWQALPSTVDPVAKTVTVQVSHFSGFSLGTANATCTQYQTGWAYPGQNDVPILNISLTNTGPTNDTVEYVQLNSNCTNDTDVSEVRIWRDTNLNQIFDIGDIPLDTGMGFSSGIANFTGLSESVPTNSSVNFFATLNVTSGATVGNVLDMFIPLYGIRMTSAGLLLETLDPTGHTIINKNNLTEPHAVYGYVKDITGTPLQNVWVNVSNTRTNSTLNTTSDNLGRYDIDLGDMAGGYADGDLIIARANDTANNTGLNSTTVIAANFGELCNITVEQGPLASNETPMDGTTISDIYENITLNITDDLSGVDASTIILEVEGHNYTVADGNLTFTAPVLTLNTTKAVGNWTSGQTVNVTLWVANDLAGNPCQNAPYVWWFNISVIGAVGRPENLTVSNVSDAVLLEWDSVALASGYNVYRSSNRFSPWPWLKLADNVTATNWTDGAGTYDDANTYYYIVRAWNPSGEGGNSSMGVKARRTFTYLEPTLRTNSNWISLPYKSAYKKLSDIVIAIEGGTTGADNDYLQSVSVWNATLQQRVGIAWFSPLFDWDLTNDLDIRPGDGICLVLSSNNLAVGEQFNLTIVGTDINSTQNFTYLDPNFRTNSNWISVPYTSNYTKLSDIVRAIEGNITGADNDFLQSVSVWNATLQQRVGIAWFSPLFDWDLTNDVDIKPGDGICLVLSSNNLTVGEEFSWDPSLITPPIPGQHYYD